MSDNLILNSILNQYNTNSCAGRQKQETGGRSKSHHKVPVSCRKQNMRCFCGHQGDHKDCCIVIYLLDSGETTDTFFQVPLLCCFFISRQETISQVNNKMFPLKCRAEASLQMSLMSRSYEFKGKECYAITEGAHSTVVRWSGSLQAFQCLVLKSGSVPRFVLEAEVKICFLHQCFYFITDAVKNHIGLWLTRKNSRYGLLR